MKSTNHTGREDCCCFGINRRASTILSVRWFIVVVFWYNSYIENLFKIPRYHQQNLNDYGHPWLLNWEIFLLVTHYSSDLVSRCTGNREYKYSYDKCKYFRYSYEYQLLVGGSTKTMKNVLRLLQVASRRHRHFSPTTMWNTQHKTENKYKYM